MQLPFIKIYLLVGWGLGAGQVVKQPINDTAWNPPSTSIDAVYVAVAKRLLGHGLADPIGGRFCREDIPPKQELGVDRTTFGWVLPGDKRIVLVDGTEVNVEGSITPVSLKGALPDLERSAQYGYPLAYWPGLSMATPALLLRMGETRQAEQVYQWRQGISGEKYPAQELATEQIGCLETLAFKEFATRDDLSARADFDRVIEVWKIRDELTITTGTRPSYRFKNIQMARADVQRRIDHPEKALNLGKLSRFPRADRIRALIGALDTIGGAEPSKWSFNFADAPIVKALIREGRAAVPFLMDAMETDNRLCRAVIVNEGNYEGQRAYSDKEVAWEAIKAIWPSAKALDISEPSIYFPHEPPSPKLVREKWAAGWNLSDGLQWLAMLRDDRASEDIWSTAASGLVSSREPNSVISAGSEMNSGDRIDYIKAAPRRAEMMGASLASQDRSEASRLMARRATQIIDAGKPGEPTPWPENAFRICEALYAWDPKGSVPCLREVCDRILRSKFQIDRGQMSDEADEVVKLIGDRLDVGDTTATADYERVFKTLDSQRSYGSIALLHPVWKDRMDAAIQRVGRERLDSLKADLGGHDIQRARRAAQDIGVGSANLSLISNPAFRRALVAGLRNHTVVGSFRIANEGGTFVCWFTNLADGASGSAFDASKFPEWKPGMSRNVELCDDLAHIIANHGVVGDPKFSLLWSDKKRAASRSSLIDWLSNDKLDWKKIQQSNAWAPYLDQP